MADYIYPAPGVTGVEATLTLSITGNAGNLVVPSLQDITVNASNDLFTWTTLDEAAKRNVATTSTNSLSMNLVLEQTSFFGNYTTVANEAALPTSGMIVGEYFYATAEDTWHEADNATTTSEVAKSTLPADILGIFGMSNDKKLVNFSLYLGDTSTSTEGKTISGEGYITGLAPTVSADSPVWISPITITVDGSYAVA